MDMLEKEDSGILRKLGVNFTFLVGVMVALILVSMYYS